MNELFFLFICIYNVGLSNGDCSNKNSFIKQATFEGTVITDHLLWSKSGRGSPAACSNECFRDDQCVSFFYNTITDLCVAHPVRFYSTEPGDAEEGNLYYTRFVDKRDCEEILMNDPTSQDGVYTINPFDGKGAVRVYCDMTTDGGGWTVFQRRVDGSVDFYRNWTEYKSGFGNLKGNFWQGNDVINRLTSQRDVQLRIDMLDMEGQSGYAMYSTFKVDNEANNYQLTVAGFSGNRGDSLAYHNGMDFSTLDKDHDLNEDRNCAQDFLGGWWYKNCHSANPNGMYGNTSYGQGINWHTWRGLYYSLKWIEIKMKAN